MLHLKAYLMNKFYAGVDDPLDSSIQCAPEDTHDSASKDALSNLNKDA